MRKKVEYYNGKTINREVIKRINLIDLTIIQEGITQLTMERIKSPRQLCKSHETTKDKEHILIGDDWYIIYTEISDYEIEIKDWMAIHSSENKFIQSMEMYNALKQILLQYQDYDIKAILRHSTSYPFYKKLIQEGYIEEGCDIIDLDDCTEKLKKIKETIFSRYDSYEEYLNDQKREKYTSLHVEDYIYHEVNFNVTKTFINKYKKSGR